MPERFSAPMPNVSLRLCKIGEVDALGRRFSLYLHLSLYLCADLWGGLMSFVSVPDWERKVWSYASCELNCGTKSCMSGSALWICDQDNAGTHGLKITRRKEARATPSQKVLVLYQSNWMFLWTFWPYIDTIAHKCPYKSWKPGCRI